MSTRIGKAKIKTTATGKVVIEPSKPRMAAGQRKNAEGKAKREAASWAKRSKGSK